MGLLSCFCKADLTPKHLNQSSINRTKKHKNKLLSYNYWVELIRAEFLPVEDPEAIRENFKRNCKQHDRQSATEFQTLFRAELQKTDIKRPSKQAAAFLDAIPRKHWEILDQEYIKSDRKLTLEKLFKRHLQIEDFLKRAAVKDGPSTKPTALRQKQRSNRCRL